jgi:hypothetical protein
MTISYVLAPLSSIQYVPFDVNNSLPIIIDGQAITTLNYMPYAQMETFKSDEPTTHKPTYQDEGGTVEHENPIRADAGGRFPLIYFETGGTEKYYLRIMDQDGKLIDDVNNFPPTEGGGTPVTTEIDFTNHILNGQFRYWRTRESDEITTTESYLADGGWTAKKSNASGTHTLSFKEFNLGQLTVPENPKYYLEYVCSVTGGGTIDAYYAVGDVFSFENVQITLQFVGWSPGSATVEAYWIQHFGTGGSADFPTLISSYSLTPTETKRYTTFVVPTTGGKTLGVGDKAILNIRYPDTVSTVRIANVAINLGDKALDYEYLTSVQESINTNAEDLPRVIEPTESGNLQKILPGSFRSVDLDLKPIWRRRVGHIFQYAFGTPIPDGEYKCDWGSYFRDTDEDLYNAIGNMYGPGEYGFSGHLTSNVGRIVNWIGGSVSDIVDSGTGFTFTKVQDGVDYGFLSNAYIDNATQPYVTVTNKANGVVIAASSGTTSFSFDIIQTGTASLPEITNIIPTATVVAGTYFLISSASTDYYPWFTIDGAGADPAVGGRTGILIPLLSTDTQTQISRKISNILKGAEIYDITFNAASTLSSGDYFSLDAVGQPYYVDAVIDGVDADPAPGGKKRLKVELDGTDTAAQVAQKYVDRIVSAQFQVPLYGGMFLRGWDHGAGNDPDAENRRYPIDYGSYTSGDAVGTYQADEMKNHGHKINGTWAQGVEAAVQNWGYLGDTPFTSSTSSVGGLETRPINNYVLYTIQR